MALALCFYLCWYFYPRSPCGERLDDLEPSTTRRLTFLSTLSLRRATNLTDLRHWQVGHFYPRSPCGERPRSSAVPWVLSPFLSTLSLRRATNIPKAHGSAFAFLSTLSLRRATISSEEISSNLTISIHALLAESDPGHRVVITGLHHFYPRSPCGERRRAPS